MKLNDENLERERERGNQESNNQATRTAGDGGETPPATSVRDQQTSIGFCFEGPTSHDGETEVSFSLLTHFLLSFYHLV